MGGEEKSSLDRDEPMPELKNFRLHYFPEITASPMAEKKGQSESRLQFKECYIKHIGGTGIQTLNDSKSCNVDESGTTSQKMNIHIYDEGYQKGFEEGQRTEKEKLDGALNALQRIFEEFALLRQSLYNEAEMAIVKLSLSIARKLLDREIAVNPDSVLSVARCALRKVVDPTKIKIRINPSDIKTVENHKDDILGQLGKNSAIRIESDGTIQRGGCIIETSFGDIDAQIDQQYQVIEKALNKEFGTLGTESTK